ncbi:methyltransferase [Paraburkholderia sp. J63]|uniref:methyltransferase n=1 Tax=Paraburkholderia sp. J63 TaxID=2805434 RepID=UPI002ABD726B|nr:methyltransferase [Paraburkholderia sp. J63]
MAKVNENYWRQQSGAEYEQQQKGRTEQGRSRYREQEAWLVAHLRSESERLGRPLSVLDFGCGFGRMARVLAACPFVVYHGYDFSPSMVQQLLDSPPEGLPDVAERVRVASSVTDAFGVQRFDVVFTVSVLIHNAREDARSLIGEMQTLLRDDGYLLLIENQIVPFDLRENNWHGGCWVHDYAGDLAVDSSVLIFQDAVEEHGVYQIRPVRDRRREVQIAISGEPVRALPDAERLQLGLARLKSALAGMQDELALGSTATLESKLHDLAENSEHQRRTLDEQALELAAARDECSRLREECESLREQCANLRNVQELRSRLHGLVAEVHKEIAPIHVVPVASNDAAQNSFSSAFPETPSVEWQASRDTIYANEDAHFDRVCHIFHHDWMGIRSAVGALPGHKLSIPSNKSIPVREIEAIMWRLADLKIEKIVLHGISDGMYMLSRAFSKNGFDKQYLVWHGTTTQWVWEDERRYAQMAIKMARDGRVKRFSAIRRGLGPIVGERNFAPQLVNMPPKVNLGVVSRRARCPGQFTALAPSWNDLRKNLTTNVLAAHTVDSVDSIYVVAKDFQLPRWLSTKVKKVGYRDHASMLELMATMDLVLNVTTIDCHPMVDLEALAVGTPSVRGPLFLDGLEDHPYVGLTSVENPMSVEDVAGCIRNVLATDESELRGLMNDYTERLRDLSIKRYREFLEI